MKNIPLYQKIFDYYYNKITSNQLKEGDKIDTEKEISKKFFVSRITARGAVDMLAERGLVTRISGKGTFVTTTIVPSHDKTKTTMIGIIMCDLESSFGLEIFKGIEKEANNQDIHIVVRNTYESLSKETSAIKSMAKLGVDGIIIQTVHGELYNDLILRMYINGFPLVLIDRHMDKTKVPFVTTGNYDSSYQVAKLLRKLGYKKVSFISAKTSDTSTLDSRYRGFREGWAKRDYYLDLLSLKTPETREKSKELIKYDMELIEKHIIDNPEIDCIFAAEYYVAHLVKDVLNKMNKRIPEDISIICYDYIMTEPNEKPIFTYIKQNQLEIGEIAVKKLCAIIEEKSIKEFPSFINCTLVQGSSLDLKGENIDEVNAYEEIVQ